MIIYIEKRRKRLPFRILASVILFDFIFSLMAPPGYTQTLPQVLNGPGSMMHLSSAFEPTLIKGITLYPDNPLKFDFIVDQGDVKLNEEALKKEATKLIKYFLATLTVPEKDLWVNLSPYEKDRIVPQGFGVTEMGKDLLSQDYILKQLTASLMNPEQEIGKKFWDKVRQKAKEKFGTDKIPTDTFNKVWIIPDKAVVYEHGTSAFVVESRLRVMLEEDYLAQKYSEDDRGKRYEVRGKSALDTSYLLPHTSQLIKEIILPALEVEVNEGKHFASLRQIYQAMILASWYKENLKESLLGQVYVDKNKTKGVDVEDKDIKQKIYEQYLNIFKKGVYDFIKDDYDPKSQEVTSRQYFSGGLGMTNLGVVKTTISNFGMLSSSQIEALPKDSAQLVVETNFLELTPSSNVKAIESTIGNASATKIPIVHSDAAMLIRKDGGKYIRLLKKLVLEALQKDYQEGKDYIVLTHDQFKKILEAAFPNRAEALALPIVSEKMKNWTLILYRSTEMTKRRSLLEKRHNRYVKNIRKSEKLREEDTLIMIPFHLEYTGEDKSPFSFDALIKKLSSVDNPVNQQLRRTIAEETEHGLMYQAEIQPYTRKLEKEFENTRYDDAIEDVLLRSVFPWLWGISANDGDVISEIIKQKAQFATYKDFYAAVFRFVYGQGPPMGQEIEDWWNRKGGEDAAMIEKITAVKTLGTKNGPTINNAGIEQLALKKKAVFDDLVRGKVIAYPSTVKLIQELSTKGKRLAVASSGRNTTDNLKEIGVYGLFPVVIDGNKLQTLGLKGKPFPDIFLKAAELAGIHPARAIVIGDSEADIQAARDDFGLVIGLSRQNDEQLLRDAGADVVYKDLEGISLAVLEDLLRKKLKDEKAILDGVIFDSDGVIVETDDINFLAWKETFRSFFKAPEHEPIEELSHEEYTRYIKGKPAAIGVKEFLIARGFQTDAAMVERTVVKRTAAVREKMLADQLANKLKEETTRIIAKENLDRLFRQLSNITTSVRAEYTEYPYFVRYVETRWHMFKIRYQDLDSTDPIKIQAISDSLRDNIQNIQSVMRRIESKEAMPVIQDTLRTLEDYEMTMRASDDVEAYMDGDESTVEEMIELLRMKELLGRLYDEAGESSESLAEFNRIKNQITTMKALQEFVEKAYKTEQSRPHSGQRPTPSEGLRRALDAAMRLSNQSNAAMLTSLKQGIIIAAGVALLDPTPLSLALVQLERLQNDTQYAETLLAQSQTGSKRDELATILEGAFLSLDVLDAARILIQEKDYAGALKLYDSVLGVLNQNVKKLDSNSEDILTAAAIKYLKIMIDVVQYQRDNVRTLKVYLVKEVRARADIYHDQLDTLEGEIVEAFESMEAGREEEAKKVLVVTEGKLNSLEGELKQDTIFKSPSEDALTPVAILQVLYARISVLRFKITVLQKSPPTSFFTAKANMAMMATSKTLSAGQDVVSYVNRRDSAMITQMPKSVEEAFDGFEGYLHETALGDSALKDKTITLLKEIRSKYLESPTEELEQLSRELFKVLVPFIESYLPLTSRKGDINFINIYYEIIDHAIKVRDLLSWAEAPPKPLTYSELRISDTAAPGYRAYIAPNGGAFGAPFVPTLMQSSFLLRTLEPERYAEYEAVVLKQFILERLLYIKKGVRPNDFNPRLPAGVTEQQFKDELFPIIWALAVENGLIDPSTRRLDAGMLRNVRTLGTGVVTLATLASLFCGSAGCAAVKVPAQSTEQRIARLEEIGRAQVRGPKITIQFNNVKLTTGDIVEVEDRGELKIGIVVNIEKDGKILGNPTYSVEVSIPDEKILMPFAKRPERSTIPQIKRVLKSVDQAMVASNLAEDQRTATDWQEVKENFKLQIAATETLDDLKRVARKMAKAVYPQQGSEDPDFEIKSQLFVELTNLLDAKAIGQFGKNIFGGSKIKTEETAPAASGSHREKSKATYDDFLRMLKERFIVLNEWTHEAWSIPEPYAKGDNDEIMGPPTRALLKRYQETVYAAPLAHAIDSLSLGLAALSVEDIEELLKITNRSGFVNRLNLKLGNGNALTINGAAIDDETLWQLRPTLRKIKKFKEFQGGEIVFIRDGEQIERTVILEPLFENHPRVKALTIDAPFQFLAALTHNTERYRYVELGIKDILDLDMDVEQEPAQTGYEINIGDVLAFDMKDEFGRQGPKALATIVATYMGHFAMVNLTRVHDGENYVGHGLSWGRNSAEEDLKKGKALRLSKATMGPEEYSKTIQDYLAQSKIYIEPSTGERRDASKVILRAERYRGPARTKPYEYGQRLELIFADWHREEIIPRAELIRSEGRYIWGPHRESVAVPFHVKENGPVSLVVKLPGVPAQIVISDNDNLKSAEDIESVSFSEDGQSVEVIYFANGDGWRTGDKIKLVAKIAEGVLSGLNQLPQNGKSQLLITKEKLKSDRAMVTTPEDLRRAEDSLHRDREGMRPALEKITHRIFDQYLHGVSSILDLGSGRGETVALAPEDMRSKFTQSDIQLERMKDNPFNTPKEAINIYQIPREDNSVEAVTAHSVLDFVQFTDKAAQEIYRVLKPGGTLVAFFDRQPFHRLLMDSFPDDILIPDWTNIPGTDVPGYFSYVRVNKEVLLRQLGLHRLNIYKDEEMHSILSQYAADPLKQIWGLVDKMQTRSQRAQMTSRIKEHLKTIEVPYEELDPIGYINDKIEKSLQDAGFKDVQYNLEESEALVDRSTVRIPQGANKITFAYTVQNYSYDPEIPEGKVKVEVSIYVAVAKKDAAMLLTDVENLKSPDRVIRMEAANRIGEANDAQAKDYLLVAFLNETDHEVQMSLLESLAIVSNKDHLKISARAMDVDDLREIRRSANELMYVSSGDSQRVMKLILDSLQEFEILYQVIYSRLPQVQDKTSVQRKASEPSTFSVNISIDDPGEALKSLIRKIESLPAEDEFLKERAILRYIQTLRKTDNKFVTEGINEAMVLVEERIEEERHLSLNEISRIINVVEFPDQVFDAAMVTESIKYLLTHLIDVRVSSENGTRIVRLVNRNKPSDEIYRYNVSAAEAAVPTDTQAQARELAEKFYVELIFHPQKDGIGTTEFKLYRREAGLFIINHRVPGDLRESFKSERNDRAMMVRAMKLLMADLPTLKTNFGSLWRLVIAAQEIMALENDDPYEMSQQITPTTRDIVTKLVAGWQLSPNTRQGISEEMAIEKLLALGRFSRLRPAGRNFILKAVEAHSKDSSVSNELYMLRFIDSLYSLDAQLDLEHLESWGYVEGHWQHRLKEFALKEASNSKRTAIAMIKRAAQNRVKSSGGELISLTVRQGRTGAADLAMLPQPKYKAADVKKYSDALKGKIAGLVDGKDFTLMNGTQTQEVVATAFPGRAEGLDLPLSEEMLRWNVFLVRDDVYSREIQPDHFDLIRRFDRSEYVNPEDTIVILRVPERGATIFEDFVSALKSKDWSPGDTYTLIEHVAEEIGHALIWQPSVASSTRALQEEIITIGDDFEYDPSQWGVDPIHSIIRSAWEGMWGFKATKVQIVPRNIMQQRYNLFSDESYGSQFKFVFNEQPRSLAVERSGDTMAAESRVDAAMVSEKLEEWSKRPDISILKGGRRFIGSSEDERLALVDEFGNPLPGTETKSHVHAKGLWHMTSHIYVFDAKGRLLLQKRSQDKKQSPGKLQVSVSGHVDAGETPQQAAFREAKEEIGINIDADRLVAVGQYKRSQGLTEGENNEFVHVYSYMVTDDEAREIEQKYNLNESDELWFIPASQLSRMIKETGQAFSNTINNLFKTDSIVWNEVLESQNLDAAMIVQPQPENYDFKFGGWSINFSYERDKDRTVVEVYNEGHNAARRWVTSDNKLEEARRIYESKIKAKAGSNAGFPLSVLEETLSSLNLVDVGRQQYIEMWTKWLNDEGSKDRRKRAAVSLGRSKQKQFINPLFKRLLQERDYEVQICLLGALMRLSDRREVMRYVFQLSKDEMTELVQGGEELLRLRDQDYVLNYFIEMLQEFSVLRDLYKKHAAKNLDAGMLEKLGQSIMDFESTPRRRDSAMKGSDNLDIIIGKSSLFKQQAADVYLRTSDSRLFFSSAMPDSPVVALIFAMIDHPLVKKEDILKRQSAVQRLMNLDQKEFDKLFESFKAALDWMGQVLWFTDRDEDSWDERRGSPMRLLKLIEDGTIKLENLDEALGKESEDGMSLRLRAIKTEVEKVNRFVSLLEKIDNPLIQELTQELKETLDANKLMGVYEDLIRFAKEGNEEGLKSLRKRVEEIQVFTYPIASFMVFANHAQREHYAKVTFDDAKPKGYKKGWSFLLPKDKEKAFNDSTADSPIVVYTGSNMSGKSFKMKTDFMIQKLAQSFGYAPAQEANLNIYEHMAYLDRPSTDSIRNLSAFGREVKDWIPVEEKIGPKSLVFIDEGGSTTSPEDQSKLLKGWKGLVDKTGAHLVLATHNEDFIESLKEDPAAGLYHFGVIRENGNIKYTYEMQPGIGDSEALAVARQRRLQEGIIKTAEEYLEGRPAVVTEVAVKKPRRIERYTPEERRKLKNQSGDFLSLFPYGNALDIVPDQKDGFGYERGQNEWRYETEEERRNFDRWDRRKRKPSSPGYTPIFRAFSRDSDFSEASFRREEGLAKKFRWDYVEAMSAMLLQNPVKDPKEILERQQMFFELIASKDRKKLEEMIITLWDFTMGLSKIHYALDGFNKYLLEHSISREHYMEKFEEYKNKFDVFKRIIRMNLKLSNISETETGIAEDFKKIEAILEVYGQWEESLREHYTKEDRAKDKDWYEKRQKQQEAIHDKFIELTGTPRDESKFRFISIRDVDKVLFPMLGSIRDRIKDKVVSADLSDPQVWEQVREDIEAMYPTAYAEYQHQIFEQGSLEEAIFVYKHLLDSADHLTPFLDELKKYDSVHMHQWANYLKKLFEHWMGSYRSGMDILRENAELNKQIKAGEQEIESLKQLQEKVRRKEVDAMEIVAQTTEDVKKRIKDLESDRKFQEKYLTSEFEEIRKDAQERVETIEKKLKPFLLISKLQHGEIIWNGADPVIFEGETFDVPAIVADFVLDYKIKRLNYKIEEMQRKINRRSDLFDRQSRRNISDELRKLLTIITMADIMEDQKWMPVELTDKMEIEVKNGWNPVKLREDQVPLSMKMDDHERVRFYAGSNMSGKTYAEKTLLWQVMSAMATGFAPSEHLKLPIFERLIYLDRVTHQEDYTLSAFGNEMAYWKEYFEMTHQAQGPILAAVDEAGSTTSPRYQEALSYGFAADMLENGHFLVMSSHNHAFLNAFMQTNGARSGIYHFRTRLDDEDKVVFDYEIEPGDDPSNSIAVARTLGLTKILDSIGVDAAMRASDDLEALSPKESTRAIFERAEQWAQKAPKRLNKTADQVAKETGLNAPVINRAAKRHGIKLRKLNPQEVAAKMRDSSLRKKEAKRASSRDQERQELLTLIKDTRTKYQTTLDQIKELQALKNPSSDTLSMISKKRESLTELRSLYKLYAERMRKLGQNVPAIDAAMVTIDAIDQSRADILEWEIDKSTGQAIEKLGRQRQGIPKDTVFVRHGETDKNIDDLNETGIRQAREAAESLIEIWDSRFKQGRGIYVITSPTSRTRQTAEIFVKLVNDRYAQYGIHLDITEDSETTELDQGTMEGLSATEQQQLRDRFKNRDVTVKAKNGENVLGFTQRVRRFRERLINDYNDMPKAIFGHGFFYAIMMGDIGDPRAFTDGRLNWWNLIPKNGEVIKIDAAMVAKQKSTVDRPQSTGVSTEDRGLTTEQITPPGGIDLNPALLKLQIRRDGKGVPLPLNQQPLLKMNIDGFLPVIINITPLTNVPLLLGFDPKSKEKETQVSYNLSSLPMDRREEVAAK